MTTSKKKTIYRSAKTGRFVKKKYAESHPATTEKEHRPVGKPKPKK
jgi:hypothetical protein